MDQGRSTGAQQPDGLRERIVSRSDSTGSRDALIATGEGGIKDEAGKDKKTFGRTPDGTGGCHLIDLCVWAQEGFLDLVLLGRYAMRTFFFPCPS